MKNYKDHFSPEGVWLKDKRFCIVVSRYNEEITKKLLYGAQQYFLDCGIEKDAVDNVVVPGAFELPLVAKVVAQKKKHVAIVVLGCVIRGETSHFNYVCEGTTDGIMRAMLDCSVPIGFGLLTTEDKQQAIARCGDREDNKGWEAASSAVKMAHLLDNLVEQLN